MLPVKQSIGLILISISALCSAQKLLVEDRFCWEPGEFSCFIDTLETYGVDVYISSQHSFSLYDADLIWIVSPRESDFFSVSSEYLDSLRRFIESGKPLLISLNGEGDAAGINYLLESIFSSLPIRLVNKENPNDSYYRAYPVGDLFPIIELTDTILLQYNCKYIDILNFTNSFPLLVSKDTVYAIISYPLLNDTFCGPPLIIISGNHTWENGFHTLPELQILSYSSIQFGKRLLLSLLNCCGYHLHPCAVPEGFCIGDTCNNCSNLNSCLSLPSPFTPNGDGINDFCQFTFPDMMFSPAVIRIYNIHSVLVKDIQVPLGWAAKSAARWYGKDNSGKPVPQGVYLYEIEQNGEVICTGTVTVAR